MTGDGVEILETLRDPGLWQQVRSTALERALPLTFPVLLQLGKEWVQRQLSIQRGKVMESNWSESIADLCVRVEDMLKDLPDPTFSSREEFFAITNLCSTLYKS